MEVLTALGTGQPPNLQASDANSEAPGVKLSCSLIEGSRDALGQLSGDLSESVKNTGQEGFGLGGWMVREVCIKHRLRVNHSSPPIESFSTGSP